MATTISLSSGESQQTLSEELQQQTLSEGPQQQVILLSEEQQQPTLFDLPVPYLMNTILEGRRVPYLVLAFPFDSEDQLRCAEVNNLRPNLEGPYRQLAALSQIRTMLPRNCDVDPIRCKNHIGFMLAVIVASNATPRSLALMHDIDKLKEVQRILGTNKCPRWARLKPDDY